LRKGSKGDGSFRPSAAAPLKQTPETDLIDLLLDPSDDRRVVLDDGWISHEQSRRGEQCRGDQRRPKQSRAEEKRREERRGEGDSCNNGSNLFIRSLINY
jgi:hypothetical protein